MAKKRQKKNVIYLITGVLVITIVVFSYVFLNQKNTSFAQDAKIDKLIEQKKYKEASEDIDAAVQLYNAQSNEEGRDYFISKMENTVPKKDWPLSFYVKRIDYYKGSHKDSAYVAIVQDYIDALNERGYKATAIQVKKDLLK